MIWIWHRVLVEWGAQRLKQTERGTAQCLQVVLAAMEGQACLMRGPEVPG